ncbi:DHA2 family efflux MFS transporter permease subunit [Halobacillus sp. ACCC02827]|uniref:DHA2 family efflux MFS transporter permease subunit n=1 Tax=Bacillaceae TaxID=186817 RepID=UPI0002A5049E|nr:MULTISPECIES: DHA2 family efflux MFS transporter permease subunit [Bacillaceae]ELK48435.1 putative MFS-type transporter [Halobacillus sp. BAB-2008]QHT47821.1 DHA2 family efflux MFS transporter permease subunit [Bacillus sp. SB49]WJE15065.1 DHA2 family efflux MFS transporter permease subunit [Halobacillus sp. ACCC02827]
MAEQTQQVEKQPINRIAIVSVLLVSAFVAILNQTLLNTALPNIMETLNVTANTSQWLMTGFMLVNGVMIPITAFLIGKFTTRRLFFTAMTLFTIGTVVAAAAPNFSVLLIGRLIQASGAGIMMPLMQTVMLMIFPVEKRGTVMGMAGLVIAFGPAIGPTLSGYLVEEYSWRTPFLIIIPIAIGAIIFGAFALKNVTEQTNPTIDVLSIILSTFGFGGLLYGFSSAGNDGWSSPNVYITLIIGVVALASFIIRQFRLETPILEFRVFGNKIYALAAVITMIVMMSMLGAELLLPIYMQTMRGFTALESGLMLLPGALVMGIMSPITGRIFDKIGARWLAITGLTIIASMTYVFSNLTADTSYSFIVTIYAIRMMGVAMVMMPVSTAGLNQLSKEWIPHGTAMNNTLRTIAGSIGTALLVTVMTNASKDYTPSAGEQPQNIMSNALIHGIDVAFLVATIIAIVGLLLSFFIKGKPKKEKKVPAAETKAEPALQTN